MASPLSLTGRVKVTLQEYPRQFWLLFTGMLISTIGSSMVWPFLMIYVTEKLQVSNSTATTLNTINAFAGLGPMLFAGPMLDRMGRKSMMVFSLAMNGLIYILQGQANSYLAFVLIMAVAGAVNPLYRVAADAMVADIVSPEKRMRGYSLLRMSHNLGISIGPAIGGFINAGSYSTTFFIAAAGMVAYSLLMLFFARETLPVRQVGSVPSVSGKAKEGSYDTLLRDHRFLWFVAMFTLVQFCAAMVWLLLSVYSKHQFGISETMYGWIPTTNALMVVLFQIGVTMVTRQFSALRVMAVGALFYAAATASIGFGQGFWAFWGSMVVMTIGELIIMPTASTYAANLAPADQRGRYMSVFSLSWALASGVSPVLGSLLGETIRPEVTWFGGAAVGIIATAGFLVLAWRDKRLMVQSSRGET